MDILSPDKLAEIRRLNDNFRTTFRGGKIFLTASVAELPDMVKAAALQTVADFKDFNKDNDAASEKDFLSFELCNRKFIFKIDYYDPTMQFGSEDPADTEKTKRVGTLMLASDY